MNPKESRPVFYAFCADEIDHNNFHFRSFSAWNGDGKQGRHVRGVGHASALAFPRSIKKLGWKLRTIEMPSDIGAWMEEGGWAIVEAKFANQFLTPLLGERICVRSPLGILLDEKLPKTSPRRVNSAVKKLVYDRDNHRCVRCGSREALTMQHAIPFSRGGASTACNLVSMCEPCNQKVGDNYDYGCLQLAGLHWGWDPKIMGRNASPGSWWEAMNISDNIVVSVVDLRELCVLEGIDLKRTNRDRRGRK